MEVTSFKSFLRRLKRNSLVFLLTFSASILLANLNPSNRGGQHELYRAAANGDVKLVQALLAAGANPNGNDVKFSPLLVAARNGRTDVVRILLDEGVNVDSIGSWGQTPLMETAWGGHVDTANLLLSRGADILRGYNRPGTALWQARLANQPEIVQLLMRHGGRNCKDAESVLTAAVEDGDTEIVKALLAGGVDPRDVTATPLVLPLTEVAAKQGNEEMLMLLRQAGAK